jgi:glycosyl transferase-like sugar-binding protein
VRFLADERLYSDTEYCLRFLRGLEASDHDGGPAGERYHLYWLGPFTRKQAFAVKCLLTTPDAARGEVWLWLDAEDGYAGHERNPVLEPLLPHLSVRPFDPSAECRGTPFEASPELHRGVSPTERSDLFRLVTLYNHGGFYLDLDMMVLRDLGELFREPFGSGEFCYRWADQPYANHAVLRLRRRSETAQAVVEKAIAVGSCDPRAILRFDDSDELGLTVLPSAFFDPLWMHADGTDRLETAPFDGFDGLFRKFGWRFRPKRGIESRREFFPGAFAFHWHNQWDAPEHERSYFARFDDEVDARI